MRFRATPRARRFLAVLFAIPIAFSVLFFVANTLAERNDTQVLKLETLTNEIEGLEAIANDAELGEHGFLLTGDDRYRRTLDLATQRLATVRILGSDEVPGPIRAKYREFFEQVKQRVRIANQVLQVQKQSSYGAALDAAHRSHSEYLMDQMRLNVKWLQLEITKESAARFDSYRELTRATFLFFLFGTLVMLIVMVWLYNTFIGYMQARDAANAELHHLNQELEHRISERTKELQEFNEELQQFAYVASHDLQEPLRTITSFSQLLAARYRGKIDEDANEFLDYIVNSAHRMSDLINGLLALLRLRKAGQISPVALDSLIDEAKVSLQAAIRESGAQITADPLPMLAVDAIQFGQVLQNLISNAIKYRRDDETPVIHVSARRDSTNWIIGVEDNGRGFDPQFAERIFGLFQRLNVGEVGGTGMGLTIVRRIVERHGGRVWAESKEGIGSTFYVSLPASLEPKNQQAVEGDVPEAALPRSGPS